MENKIKHYAKKINDDFYFVGLLDPDLSVFDIVMITKYGSSYNSYLLKTTEGYVLFETVKMFKQKTGNSSMKQYLANIESVCSPNEIKYIVLNHTEPDHAGGLEWLIKLCHPDCEVIGTKIALEYVEKIHNHRFNLRIVKTNDELKIGNKTLLFKAIPMMHWPDSMFTLIKEDKIAVTCDTLGAHYSFPDLYLSKMRKDDYEKKYLESFKYYYDVIFSPLVQPVKNAVKVMKPMIDNGEITLVATGHGPILDKKKDIDYAINMYNEWSSKQKDDTFKIVLVTCSAYGYTNTAAEIICKEINKSLNDKVKIEFFKVDAGNYTDQKPAIINAINNCDGLLFGSPTIVNDALPLIWDILISLSPMIVAGKKATAFGSFGWSGEAVPFILQRLSQLKFNVMKGMRVKFQVSKGEENDLKNFANIFANFLNTRMLDKAWKFKNIKMEDTIWES